MDLRMSLSLLKGIADRNTGDYALALNKEIAFIDSLLKEHTAVKPKHPCPECGDAMIPLRSINKKLCGKCSEYYDYHLKPGQPKLHQATR